MVRQRRSADPDIVVVTGIGLITPLGATRESSWRCIRSGRSGLRLIKMPNGQEVIGAPVPIERDERPGWVHRLAAQACDEAIEDAKLDLDRLDRDRTGCVIGMAGFPREVDLTRVKHNEPDALASWTSSLPNHAASVISHRYGLWGPCLSTAAACATGLIAVLRAADCIRDGCCDVMFAGCADASLDRLTISGFQRMRVLVNPNGMAPQEAVRPFDRQRRGFAIGEGAAMFVLERLGHALARGAPIYAVLAGGHIGADAYHVTHLDPDPSHLAWMIARALHQAGVRPDEVDYINAHGTGTMQNDQAEARAIKRALGPAATRVHISGTKSMIGHLLTAAGGVELAITALAVRDGFIPPTINLTDPDPEVADLDCTPNQGVYRPIRTALKLSIAFGGHFGAAVLRHPACYGLAMRQAA